MRDSSPDFDCEFGEPVDLIPQIGPTGKYLRRGVDSTQETRSLIGIITDDPKVDVVKSSGANKHEKNDAVTRITNVDFDERLFKGFPRPDQGWLLVRTSKLKQPRYEIVTAEPDGVSRVVCKLIFRDFLQP